MCRVRVCRLWIICAIIMACPWLMHGRRNYPITLDEGLTEPSTQSSDEDICEHHHRCEQGDRYNATVQAGYCHCDELCSLYRDCCRGADPIDGDPYNVSEYIQVSSCKAVGSMAIHVVNSCPVNYHEEHVLEFCENDIMDEDDFLLHTPVSETQFGIVFKNIFCALCHGYDTDDIRYWILELECHFPPENRIFSNQTANESETSGEPVTTFGPNYTDMNSTNSTVEEITGMAETCTKLSVTPNDVPSPRYCFNTDDSCPATWNDTFTDDMCINGPKAVVYNGETRMAYRNRHCAECDGVSMSSVVCELSPLPADIFAETSIRHPKEESSRRPGSDFISISILLDFNRQALTIRDRLIIRSRDCGKGTIYDLIANKCRMLSCHIGLVLRKGRCVPGPSDVNITLPNGSNCTLVNINDKGHYIFENGSLLLNTTGRIYDKGRYIYINDSLHLCKKEFISDALSFYGTYDIDLIQGMVSFIGQVLSILGLMTLILIYFCFSPLRTLPGKCLLCLASSLALAQTAFIAGMFAKEFDILCKSLAIFTHFTYLVSFCWMNVMAFDVWNTFRYKFSVAGPSQKKFYCYAGYCFSVPLFIVMISVIIDNIDTELSKPRYGKRFCWIGQKSALFYYFALPAGILLICNFAFFVMSVYHIFNSSGKETVTKRRHCKRKRLILYAKLSTIMGLTWVFGYMGALTGSSVMWYLCIIFNSLQGLFICIAFLCNSKVRALMASRFDSSRFRTSVLSTSLSKSFSKQKSTSSSDKQCKKTTFL